MTGPLAASANLIHKTLELLPVLQREAAWIEENRRLSSAALEAMAAAGIFKMRVPVRYGGFESDARTMVNIATELARGDGSASWTATVWWIGSWMAGLFPDELQDEIFSSPDVRICSGGTPTGHAIHRTGGIVVNGQWSYISGALHSQWLLIVAMLETSPGEDEPVMAAVPMSDLHVVDDWHTAGLRGTGSVTVIAEDLFVPAVRVMSLLAMLQERYATKLNAESPIYRCPMAPTAVASSAGIAVGLAKAAVEAFFERLPGREITFTSYTSQREAPLTHAQVGDAMLKTDSAGYHAHRLASLLDAKSLSTHAWTLEERARARADLGRAGQLAQEAVDILRRASGGSSVRTTVPIQRIERDIQAVNLHALLHPDTNLELYGRILCGLEPNTFYI